MAYIYTTINDTTPLFCGESSDKCYLCGRSLAGKDCLQEADFLICFEDCQGGSD